MGDEVWDWLFEPNAPGFGEDYLPPEWSAFVGSGGIEAQMDQIAIAQHARPTGPTPEIPDPSVIMDAFAAIGRSDLRADALPVGEQMLDVERGVEAAWVPDHAAAVARAMPWTAAHLTSAVGGVDFAALAIAGYYDGLWSRLTGAPHRTQVRAVAPAPGTRRVPATGWTGSFGPGSHLGNSAGTTRIAAALSTALPYRPLATGAPVAAELPTDTFVLRVAATGLVVPPRAGYPRIVPYGPDAGEHVIAFQPAGDLVPCTWYRAEVTDTLRDARGQSVEPRSVGVPDEWLHWARPRSGPGHRDLHRPFVRGGRHRRCRRGDQRARGLHRWPGRPGAPAQRGCRSRTASRSGTSGSLPADAPRSRRAPVRRSVATSAGPTAPVESSAGAMSSRSRSTSGAGR